MTARQALTKVPLTIMILIAGSTALALPDDREQPIQVDADSNEIFMDEGRAIYYGAENEPAVITQGSLKISGMEIIIERDDAGNLSNMAATGNPARFQQQPQVESSVIHGQANSIHYNHDIQLLTLEEEAELLQDNNRVQGYFVEYDMANNRTKARSRDDEDRVNMTIQPDAVQDTEQGTEEPEA